MNKISYKSFMTINVVLSVMIALMQPILASESEEARIYRFFGFDASKVKNGMITVEEGPNLDMIKSNNDFGYSPEEIAKHFHHKIKLTYDFRGFDPNAVKAPPKAGVHPRVLFGPDELADLRERLTQNKEGKIVMSAIRKKLDGNIRKENSQVTKAYRALVEGDTSVLIYKNLRIPYGTLYESFRCLIDNDKKGGLEVAKAITTIAKISYPLIENKCVEYKKKNPSAKHYDFQYTAKVLSLQGSLGLMYDWAHKWMNPVQRNIVRDTIALASTNMTLIGAQTLRTPRSSSSNWVSWTSRLVSLLTAIEGEEGYDESSYKRCVYAMKWFYALSVFPDGESMEGWGKQFMMGELAYMMARRGEPLMSLQNVVRGPFRKFWIHSLNPWGKTHQGGSFTFYDSQGGTDNHISSIGDVLVYKKLYPKDPYIDFVFRNTVGEDYARYKDVNIRNDFMSYSALTMAIFATHFDESKSWKEARDSLAKSTPLTYFGEDTGTMITRSNWKSDSLYLYFLPKNIMGGHKYADRGHFNVYADGRYWSVYERMRQVGQAYLPMNRTTVLIDGLGVSLAPGKSLAFKDNALATFSSADLKISYDYNSNYIHHNLNDRDHIVQLPYSYNDFRLKPSDRPSWNIQIEKRPHWQSSRKPKPMRKRPAACDFWTKRAVSMQKAFRTVGMVRGENPYILVIDDIKKDNKEREYEWGMTLAKDVILQKSKYNLNGENYKAEALLSEKDVTPDKSRKLICRLLRGEGIKESGIKISSIVSKNPPQADKIIPKLTFTTKTNEPKFVLLMTPGGKGRVEPKTIWNKDYTELKIQWENQEDVIQLKENTNGRSIPVVKRNGKVIGGL